MKIGETLFELIINKPACMICIDLSFTWKQSDEEVIVIFDQEGLIPNRSDLDISFGNQYVLIKFPGKFVKSKLDPTHISTIACR